MDSLSRAPPPPFTSPQPPVLLVANWKWKGLRLERQLLFQRNWVRFPATPGWLTTVCNSSSRGFGVLFWPLHHCTHVGGKRKRYNSGNIWIQFWWYLYCADIPSVQVARLAVSCPYLNCSKCDLPGESRRWWSAWAVEGKPWLLLRIGSDATCVNLASQIPWEPALLPVRCWASLPQLPLMVNKVTDG